MRTKALALFAGLAVAGLGMALSSLLVVLNAARLARGLPSLEGAGSQERAPAPELSKTTLEVA